MQGEKSSLQQVYDLLRTRPEPESLSIFHRIRAGESHDSILQSVHHGDLLLQLSLTSGATARTNADPDDLTNGHPTTDGSRPSSSRSELPSPHAYSPAGRPSSSVASTRAHTSQDPGAASAARRHSSATPRFDQLFDRYQGCEIVEPMLDEVQPSQWTTVTDDNEVMRSLLSLFFQGEYRWGSIFHKDHFLQDMASGEQAHCSPLLVNTVLACALHASRDAMDRRQHREPGHGFLSEARRLWESELDSGNDRLTTVQAGLLLGVIHGVDSLDTMGWKCAARSIEMALNLGLFDADIQMADDARDEHARSYTAWSVFCWQSLWCHHFFIPPLIDHPPPRPLPDPRDKPEWYGEIHIRYPSTEKISASGHGHLFRAKAHFSMTLNDISHMSFSF